MTKHVLNIYSSIVILWLIIVWLTQIKENTLTESSGHQLGDLENCGCRNKFGSSRSTRYWVSRVNSKVSRFCDNYKKRSERVTACIHKRVAYKITGAVPSCEQKCLEIADE